MKTAQNVDIVIHDRGILNGVKITVPKGVRLSHKTASGIDKKYHFIDEFGWIKENYPEICFTLKSYAEIHGINIPKAYVNYES